MYEEDGAALAALSNVRRAAEAARVTVARTSLAPGVDVEEVSKRLAASARALEQVQTVIDESTLRYQTVYPSALPAVPGHVPEFLNTRKQVEMEAADARAERLGAALNASLPVSEYNLAIIAMQRQYAAWCTQAVAAMRARSAALLSSRSRGDGAEARGAGGAVDAGHGVGVGMTMVPGR